MVLEDFHPAVARWFEDRFGEPTPPQARAWPLIRAGQDALIAAPTGSGKTLAAFLAALDSLVRQSLAGRLEDETQVVYVSPLKALSNDVQLNLEEPLAGIRRQLEVQGLPDAPLRTMVRTGDTPAASRTAMVRRPPHILVTTPESLYILLTSEGGRRMLRRTRTVIVDEIHAVAASRRGSHLALSLERLERLAGRPLQRIGLSATQRPIEEVARFLVGWRGNQEGPPGAAGPVGRAADPASGAQPPACAIIDEGHGRALDLAIEVPGSPLEAVMAAEVWQEIYDRLAELTRQHHTSLVFANTRRMAERVARHLAERLGDERVASHHGSLSREQRLAAERRLKSGELSVLVATASLELGIDIGTVDLVCQLGSTRAIATLLQRVGRSGHRLGALPKGRVFPTSRDELVEAAALVSAARRGELDILHVPRRPLDILAQQIVAAVAAEEWREDDLFALVRRAYPFHDLERSAFDEVVDMLAAGFTTRRGRRGAYLHRDAVGGRLRARRGARLVAVTSGGAIPDTADYQVVLEPSGTLVGTVHEDFAVESLAGDVFQLGNTSWRILKVEPGRVLVEDARGQPPTIPFWLGEAPARTAELSRAVSRLRSEVAARLAAGGREAARGWLLADADCWLPEAAASQLVDYLAAGLGALGALPTQETLIAERFFDEAGDMHLVVHSPFGSRLNRAWGLALRKRFCQTFNFELQAAASEDAIVLSLGPTHSFPLPDVFSFLHSRTVRGVVTQALLDSPLFGVRWRWNAGRALALPRWQGGRRVPAPLLRQQSEDLIAVVFPDQLACLENIVGEREIPDHPLVAQALEDCLEEAMDTAGLERLLVRMERGELELLARDLTAPSPLAHEILSSNPYTFLDDAPLEERRTRAVQTRWLDPLDPENASDLGALDPAAIARVRAEAWPEASTPDELHDALLTSGFLTAEEGRRADWQALWERLLAEKRGARLWLPGPGWQPDGHEAVARAAAARAAVADDGPVDGHEIWVAVERLPELRALHPGGLGANRAGGPGDPPGLVVPARYDRAWTVEEAMVELVRGRLEVLGPTTAADLAASAGVRAGAAASALAALESEGFVLRGRFTPGAAGEEWCERRLLARIHRHTLDRLRREIQPVSQADFMRFLLGWQRVASSSGEGPAGAANQTSGPAGGSDPGSGLARPHMKTARDPAAAAGRPAGPQGGPELGGPRPEGPDSLPGLLTQLEGFEAPASAWEGEILPARMKEYDPLWLDALCLAGRFVWTRISPPSASGVRRGPVRATPLAIVARPALAGWLELAPGGAAASPATPASLASTSAASASTGADLSSNAAAVWAWLEARGASFFGEIAAGTHLLHTQAEAALGELVAGGLVTADSFTGLRALLVPAHKRPPVDRAGRRRPGPASAFSVENAGRWSLVRSIRAPAQGTAGPPAGTLRHPSRAASPEALAALTWSLLRRYGVVFRRLLERESLLPPWRDLLPVLRRLEARGEIRGGRFVDGFSGEQFALPEAVGQLRAVRRAPRAGLLVSVSASDPLNLVGIVTPGERVPALAGNRVLLRDGEPIAVYEGRQVRFLVDLPPAERWRAQGELVRRNVAPRLKAYLGRSA